MHLAEHREGTMAAAVLETNSATVQEDGADVVRVNQYLLGGKLGEGAYGVVLECLNDKKEHFAIKVLSKSLLKRQKEYTKVGRKMEVTTALDDVRREIAVMKKLDHPRIVKLIEVVDDPDNDKLFMIMELVSGGQVMEWNKTTKGFTSNPRLLKPNSSSHEMGEDHARTVILDVLYGLDYLHRSHVVHRDLKPQNLLLTNESKISVKIADFGVAHMFESLSSSGEAGSNTNASEEKLTRVKGTYPFYAPECLEPTSFDGYKADIWALGINLYCFLTGKLPFYDESPPDLFDMIRLNPVDFDVLVTLGCSPAAINFCKSLLEKDATKRYANAKAVLSSGDPWLGEVSLEIPAIQKAISITEADLDAALTPVTLNIATIASLKVMVSKWRKRASVAAMRRREDEIRNSFDSASGVSPSLDKKFPSTVSLTSEGESSVHGLSKNASQQQNRPGSDAKAESVQSNHSIESDVDDTAKRKGQAALRGEANTMVEKAIDNSQSSTKQLNVPSSLVASASTQGDHPPTMPKQPATKRKSRACLIS